MVQIMALGTGSPWYLIWKGNCSSKVQIVWKLNLPDGFSPYEVLQSYYVIVQSTTRFYIVS